jgi:adenylate cyclase
VSLAVKRFAPLAIALAFGVCSAAYVFLERQLAWTHSPVLFAEQKIFDYKFLLRGRVPVDSKVVIAAGDEKTIASWGRWGTWDRARYKRVLDNLFAAKADVVAFDIVFSDPVGIDHQNTEMLKTILDAAQLSSGAGALALRAAEKKGAVGAEDIAQFAMAAKALEDHVAYSTAGDERLTEAFDEYTSQVVQGIIANPNPDEGERVFRTKEEMEALAPFVLTEYGFGWKITELDDKAREAGVETLVAELAKHEGGSPRDLFSVPRVEGHLILPAKRFLDVASNIGFFSADPDSDGVMRKLPLVYRVGDAFVPSLSLSAAALHFGATPVLLADRTFQNGLARIGFAAEGGKIIEVPVEPSGALRVNYYGPAGPPSEDLPDDRRGTFPRVSLADLHDGTFDRDLVKGKIVLVAVTAIGTFDQRVTPFSPIAPGTEIHAAAIQNMVSGQAFSRPVLHLQIEMVLAIVVAILLGLMLPRVNVTASLSLVLLFAGGWLALDFLVLFRRSLWFYDLPMLLQLAGSWAGITVWGYLSEGREKAQLKREFSTVLAPTVVEQLLLDPKLAGLGGMERELTVMFSDIRGFTSMSEKLSPEGLTQFLNEYLTPMTEILIQREGTLDKYMGDAIMAFWGAPIEQKDHAARACLAGLDMLAKLDELKQKWRAEGKPDIDIGIGLNSGLMRVGFMGSERMRNYTLLGDNVNLGSRLEGTNKSYGTHIIVSESTYAAAKELVYGRWLDAVRVKGKAQPVNIYELLGRRPTPGGPAPADEQQLIDVFEAGLKHYRAQQWDDAALAFKAASQLRKGGDPTSEIYLERIARFRQEPPPTEWDGVYELKTK